MFSREDVAVYVEYFIDQEKKAIEEYEYFIEHLPEKGWSDVKKAVQEIMEDEAMHLLYFQALAKRLE